MAIIDSPAISGASFGLQGRVSTADVEAAVAMASDRQVPLVLDRDINLSGNVRIRQAVHIVVPVGVRIGGAALVDWVSTRSSADVSQHLGGLFSFLPGAAGSIFELNGDIDLRSIRPSTVGGAPVRVAAIAVLHSSRVRLLGRGMVRGGWAAVALVDSDHALVEHWDSEGCEATVRAEACDALVIRASARNQPEIVRLAFCDDVELKLRGRGIVDHAAHATACCRVNGHVNVNATAGEKVWRGEDLDAEPVWSHRGRALEDELTGLSTWGANGYGYVQAYEPEGNGQQ